MDEPRTIDFYYDEDDMCWYFGLLDEADDLGIFYLGPEAEAIVERFIAALEEEVNSSGSSIADSTS